MIETVYGKGDLSIPLEDMEVIETERNFHVFEFAARRDDQVSRLHAIEVDRVASHRHSQPRGPRTFPMIGALPGQVG